MQIFIEFGIIISNYKLYTYPQAFVVHVKILGVCLNEFDDYIVYRSLNNLATFSLIPANHIQPFVARISF